MSITLHQLCANDNFRWGLRIVAGKEGLNNIVQWVHTLEDEEVVSFLHGGELVFTTGIGQKNWDTLNWLLPLVKGLRENEASGIVINIGPYISKVPEEVIEYANKVGFPVFTMPWDVHVVDVTRDLCGQIIAMDKREDNIGNILQNIIFYPEDLERYKSRLEKNGFLPSKICCIGVKVMPVRESEVSSSVFIERYIKRKIKNNCEMVGSFDLQDITYFVLGDCNAEVLLGIVEDLKNLSKEKEGQNDIFIAVGPVYEGLEMLSQNYKNVTAMLQLRDMRQTKIMSYDDLGIKKVLLAVHDMEVLKDYEHQIIGKLKEYDTGNNTNFTELLRLYLENDCSVQKVAELTVSHRNTVNYQIKKIKNIMGYDISTLEKKLELVLAYQIHDLLG